MAAPYRLLVDLLLRQASTTNNATSYLQTLALASLSNIQSRDGAQIVSVSVNGKSTTLQIPAGSWHAADIAACAEYALQLLEMGATRTHSAVSGRLVD